MGIAGTIAKNTLFNFIATTSDFVVNFVVSIVLARSLGTEQYGAYAFLMWFLGFATLFANLGMGSMATRFIAESIGRQDTNDQKGLVRLTLVLRGVATLFIAVIVGAFSGFWASIFGYEDIQVYFILLALLLLPNSMNFVLMTIFAGFQKYEYNAYLILGSNPLRAILVIALAFYGFGIRELLTASVFAWVVGLLIGLFLLRRLVPLKSILSSSPLNPALRRNALKYALAITGVIAINYFLWEQAEVLFLGLYCSAELVGFYTLASNLPFMIRKLIPSVLGAVIFPAITEQYGKGDMQKLKSIYLTSSRYLMILAMPLAAGGIALAQPIIGLFYGTDYTAVIGIMQLLFIPIVFASINQVANAVIYGINQPAFILKMGGLLALLNVGLSLWLIPKYGVMGAIIASSLPRIFTLPVYIGFASRKIGVTWPLGDTLKIALASAIMGLVVFGLQLHLDIVLSLSLLIPLGIVLYVVAIMAFGVVRKQDLAILNEVQGSLPPFSRKFYTAILVFAKKVAR